MTGTLRKLESTNENLRTQSVDGTFDNMPEVGQPFRLIGKSLTAGGWLRAVTTSLVVSVDKIRDEEYEFRTYNSHYILNINREAQ